MLIQKVRFSFWSDEIFKGFQGFFEIYFKKFYF